MYTTQKAPLSKTQLGIYVESMSFQESTLYNLPFLGVLGADICIERLKDAIEKACLAHPGLNVRIFMDENGEIMQQISQDTFQVDVIELSDDAFAQQKDKLVRPFDLPGYPSHCV